MVNYWENYLIPLVIISYQPSLKNHFAIFKSKKSLTKFSYVCVKTYKNFEET